MKLVICIAIYYILINLFAIILYFIDKRKAVADAWRIPEKTLILVAALGGGYGAYFAMKVFHHKTKKLKFKILVPLFAVLHIVVIYKIYMWL